jgi:hypothetical protein
VTLTERSYDKAGDGIFLHKLRAVSGVIRCIRLGTTNVTLPGSGAANFAFFTTLVRYLTNYLASFELKILSPSTGLSKRRQCIVVQRD